MRIAFLCGSLEPGRDGVGDHTRLLAEECVRQGHRCCLIALNDGHLTTSTSTSTEEPLEVAGLPTLRSAAGEPWPQRIERTAAFCARFDPDWVSLQFVPYGFNPKGFVWNLGQHLRRMVKGARWHLMFHELWIGAHREALWKERLLGGMQKMGVLRMIRLIAPTFVTTSNSAYVAALQKEGIRAELLPLFGNIPIAEQPKVGWFYDTLREAGVTVESGDRNDCWVFAFFGTLHPVWRPEPLFSYLKEVAKRWRKTVVIASIGRLGPGEALWARLSREYADAFRFVNLGERPSEQVSGFLQSADFGIAASPWELSGKSSAVAGMVEHGLPVIVSRDDVHFAGFRNGESHHPGLMKMDADLPARLSSLRRRPPKAALPAVAANFVRSLQEQSITAYDN